MEPLGHGASLPGAGRADAPDGGVRAPRGCGTLPAVNRRREEQQLVATLECLECGEESDDARGWRAYLDEQELLVYCGDCASREFDC